MVKTWMGCTPGLMLLSLMYYVSLCGFFCICYALPGCHFPLGDNKVQVEDDDKEKNKSIHD